jgi:hypothetical protein
VLPDEFENGISGHFPSQGASSGDSTVSLLLARLGWCGEECRV